MKTSFLSFLATVEGNRVRPTRLSSRFPGHPTRQRVVYELKIHLSDSAIAFSPPSRKELGRDQPELLENRPKFSSDIRPTKQGMGAHTSWTEILGPACS